MLLQVTDYFYFNIKFFYHLVQKNLRSVLCMTDRLPNCDFLYKSEIITSRYILGHF